jgi:hypothetical protein
MLYINNSLQDNHKKKVCPIHSKATVHCTSLHWSNNLEKGYEECQDFIPPPAVNTPQPQLVGFEKRFYDNDLVMIKMKKSKSKLVTSENVEVLS